MNRALAGILALILVLAAAPRAAFGQKEGILASSSALFGKIALLFLNVIPLIGVVLKRVK